MKKIIMSNVYGCFCTEFNKIGYEIIPADTISSFHTPEQRHADMQCLKIGDKYFILNECNNLKHHLALLNPTVIFQKAEKNYPKNVLLNCLYLNDVLYGKVSAIADEVKDFCNINQIKIVNVNQGYTHCSTLVIDENAVITADNSIATSLENNGVEVLKICAGHIVLEGFNYGFIGGAGIQIDDIIFFFGNIKNHPDYNKIEHFISKHNKNIKILSSEIPLTDIGGIVKIS